MHLKDLLFLFILIFTASCASQWVLSGDDIYNKNKENVGIGTTNPEFKLTVVDTLSAPQRDYTGLKVTIASPSEARAIYGASLHQHSINNYGGYFESAGSGSGVFGKALDEENGSYGGVFHSYGKNGVGVLGLAVNSGNGIGNFGGRFDARGENGIGIFAKGGSNGYAAQFHGNVQIASRISGELVIELGEGLDIAEGFDVDANNSFNLQPGMVVSIDQINPGKVLLCQKAYDTRVAGVVAGAKDLGSAIVLGSNKFDIQVALTGRVYCFVDASNNAVRPGDLLTTSAVPGYAMKAVESNKSRGAILGKAMDTLEKDQKGLILILVTLQ